MSNTLGKQLVLEKHQYYETHLSIVNGILPIKLTPKEIQVLARFMSFEGDIGQDRFGTTARRIVREELNLSDGGLGNYMKILKDKQFIIPDKNDPDKFIIQPFLKVNPKEQTYIFKITNKDTKPTGDKDLTAVS